MINMEHVIEITEGTNVVALVHVERDGRISRVAATPSGYSHVHKWKVKSRAEAILRKLSPEDQRAARIVSTWGGYCYGSKSTVPGLNHAPKGIRG
jgi:hypothetical protein